MQRARRCARWKPWGLPPSPARSAAQLSGGQQQRLALARALVAEPRLLLLDEPLSNLDALLREQMRSELRRLQKEVGVTAIYVTHDQSEALALSDRIAVMHNGRDRADRHARGKSTTSRATPSSPASSAGAMCCAAGCIERVRGRRRADRNGARAGALRGAGRVGDMAPGAALIRPEHVVLAARRCRRRQGPTGFSGTVSQTAFLGEAIESIVAGRGRRISWCEALPGHHDGAGPRGALFPAGADARDCRRRSIRRHPGPPERNVPPRR